ncbi:MAG: BTAD domain-containing putative transcriptional regulator [Candidatus Hydrogenedentes bacterium]|nr:BTAD domain-containing putative transcriptional regulator [Candidatus Hydrogenedentota bacterium]
MIGAPGLDKFASDTALALVDCASDAAFAIDGNQTIVNWNRAARQCLGYVASEVIGQHCSGVLQAVYAHGEPLCVPSCEGIRCFRHHAPFTAPDCYVRHKDGNWIPVNIASVAMSERVQKFDGSSVLAVIFMRRKDEKQTQPLVPQTLQIFTFGRFGLAAGGRRLATEKWQRKQQALTLLKLLVARVGRTVPREVLSEWLWPDADEHSGRERLKVTIYALRHQLRATGLNEEIIETVDGGYLLRREAVWIDVEAFTQRATDGAAHQRQEQWEEALQSYTEARRLYRGDYMEENIHADWCAEERGRLREVYLEMLASMAECYAATDRYAEAGSVCRSILVDDPCREGIHRTLMAYLAHLGHYDSAVAQYHHCARILAEELDVEPMPETRRLYEQILAGEARTATEKHDRSDA